MASEEVIAMTLLVRAKSDLHIKRTLDNGTIDIVKGDIEEIAILRKSENNICFRFIDSLAHDRIGRIIDIDIYSKFFDEVTKPRLKSWKEKKEPLPGEQLELF